MRRGFLVLVGFALLLALWWFGLRPGGEDAARENTPVDAGAGLTESEAAPELEGAGSKPAPAEGIGPEAAPPEAGAAGAVTVSGRVLNERRQPIAGAVVVVSAGYDGGQYGLTGTTDTDGRYRIAGLRPPAGWGPVAILARHADRAGLASTSLMHDWREDLQVPDILLGTTHGLEIEVRHEDAGPVGAARILLLVLSHLSAAPLADVEADQAGRYRFEGLPPGTYRVLAAAGAHGRGSATRAVPKHQDGPLVITLGKARELVALVSDKTTGEAIAGARVWVDEVIVLGGRPSSVSPWLPELPPLLTDAAGRVRIPGLGAQDAVHVAAEAEGYPRRGNSRSYRSVALEATQARVELERLRTLSWTLAADNPHAPPMGTHLEVVASRDGVSPGVPTSVRLEGGKLIAEGCSPQLFHATVLAPGGVWARIYASRAGAERGVVFQKARTVSVLLKHADGSAAVGYYISARNQGNMVIVDPIKLGGDGRAELKISYEHLIDVFASSGPHSYAGTSIGSIDLAKEDGGTIEATLPTGSRVELTIRIDGEARLPTHYTLRGVLNQQEDPDAGKVRFEVGGDRKKPRKVFLTARGYLMHTLQVPPTEAGTTTKIEATLVRGGSVLLKVRPPSDGRSNVQVHKPGETIRGYRYGPGVPTIEDLGEQDGWMLRRIGPFAAGTYEASDGLSQARSAPFRVESRQETVVELDLSAVGIVRGRVEVPDGYRVSAARVGLRPKGTQENPFLARLRRAYVNGDGTFQLRVPGDRPVTLEVSHPKLLPAEPGGTARVTLPRDGLVLKLAEAGFAHFLLEPAQANPPSAPGRTTVDVLLFRGEAKGEADWTLRATPKEDGYSFFGFPPGTYTVVVDVSSMAPAFLGRHMLESDTDLGTVTPPAGARLRLRVLVPPGQDPPRIVLSATSQDGLLYTRRTDSTGESEVIVTGLGAGTFRVGASSMRGMGTPGTGQPKGAINETIECDGQTEITLIMDLR